MAATAFDWFVAPLSGAPNHTIAPWVYWHARLMVLAWGVLLPLGALLARYFKVMPGQAWPRQLDDQRWWLGHRVLQWAGVVSMSLGLALVLGRAQARTEAAWWHAAIGWSVVLVGWLQLVAGLLRGTKGGPTDVQPRGDHYDMTRRRVWFEIMHKGLGWPAILAAEAVIVLGLVVADAPRWMAIVLAVWWLALAALAWRWQRRGRCIDTYQAIWGPDPAHPGNRRPPIGWGVHRPALRKPGQEGAR